MTTTVLSSDEERLLRGQAVEMARSFAHLANDKQDIVELYRTFSRQALATIAPYGIESDGFWMPEDRAREAEAQLRERIESPGFTGYPANLAVINDKLMGLRARSLITLGARPRIGKTSLGYQLAEEVAEQTHRPCWVGYFSPEQSDPELRDRSIVGHSHVKARNVATGALGEVEQEVLFKSCRRLGGLRLWVYEKPEIDCDIVEAVIHRSMAATQQLDGEQPPLGVIFVDHLQRMRRLPGLKEHESLSIHVRGLKSIAKNHDICVVLMSQFNRLERGQRPRLEDFRYTAEIEAESDVCLALHRDEDNLEVLNQQRASTDFYALKNRHGACFSTTLDFVRNDTRYEMPVALKG